MIKNHIFQVHESTVAGHYTSTTITDKQKDIKTEM